MILGGEEITVPTIVQDMDLSLYCLQDSSNGQACEETITYCIPVTEEAFASNEALIQSASSTISRPTTDTFPFLDGYIFITTSIYYSYRPAQKAPYTPDCNYRLEAVSIDRSRGPGGVGTPIWGIDGSPVVDMHLYGAQEFGGDVFQESTYSLNWGLVKDISSDFNLVFRSNVSYGYAEFLFHIINDSGRVECICPHHFAV